MKLSVCAVPFRFEHSIDQVGMFGKPIKVGRFWVHPHVLARKAYEMGLRQSQSSGPTVWDLLTIYESLKLDNYWDENEINLFEKLFDGLDSQRDYGGQQYKRHENFDEHLLSLGLGTNFPNRRSLYRKSANFRALLKFLGASPEKALNAISEYESEIYGSYAEEPINSTMKHFETRCDGDVSSYVAEYACRVTKELFDCYEPWDEYPVVPRFRGATTDLFPTT